MLSRNLACNSRYQFLFSLLFETISRKPTCADILMCFPCVLFFLQFRVCLEFLGLFDIFCGDLFTSYAKLFLLLKVTLCHSGSKIIFICLVIFCCYKIRCRSNPWHILFFNSIFLIPVYFINLIVYYISSISSHWRISFSSEIYSCS